MKPSMSSSPKQAGEYLAFTDQYTFEATGNGDGLVVVEFEKGMDVRKIVNRDNNAMIVETTLSRAALVYSQMLENSTCVSHAPTRHKVNYFLSIEQVSSEY